ncbi:Pterin 4 alpha carbinolamine dehydratase domain containing protein [Naviculisporaceae sp. PSN 640]
MKPHSNLATKLGRFGLCKPQASSRPTVHSIPSHNIASPRFVSHAVRTNHSRPTRVKLGPIHQYQHQLQFAGVRHSSAMPSAKFSPGSEGPAMEATLSRLLAEGGSGRWSLTADGQGIERNFKFKTFTKTWDFMTAVSLQCKIKNHHPEWSNVYNTTFIRWTTHSPRGLSSKDVELASICDSLAKDFGEIVDTTSTAAPSSTETSDKKRDTTTTAGGDGKGQEQEKLEKPAGLVMSNLADEAVTASGGDCGCGPKK